MGVATLSNAVPQCCFGPATARRQVPSQQPLPALRRTRGPLARRGTAAQAARTHRRARAGARVPPPAAVPPPALWHAPGFFAFAFFGGVRPGIGGDSELSHAFASSSEREMSLSFTALSN